MDERLAQLAAGLGGVFGSRDVKALRIPPTQVAAAVRSGEAIRVRRGAFVLASAWSAPVTVTRPNGTTFERPPMAVDRFRLCAMATLRSRPATDALSHHASCVVQDVAIHGADLTRVDIASAIAKPSRSRGLALHPGIGLPVDLVGGVRCITLSHALVQIAATSGTVAAVCSMDDALHKEVVTLAELRAVAGLLPGRHRITVLELLSLLDGRAESVGESRTRLLLRDLGFTVEVQVWIEDETGRIGRVDFLVDGVVVVEFDGLVKYEGMEGRAALAAEKARESRLSATGREVVRVVWTDLDDPAEFARRIRIAKKRALARRAGSAHSAFV